MSKPNIEAIDGELNITQYARNQSKMAAIEIRDHLAKIDVVSGMVRDGLLEPELYKDWVGRVKVEIKDAMAQIYGYLHLDDIKGHYDRAFVQSVPQGGGKE
ncbi:hypothetical protein UY286_21770 [Paenibacillus polymyxa]|uniref:hypothetical protein n=1 Tax=Paenibacillus polymyxa TaxID=1406 RepID=UPI002AB57EDE|nr:hypothetical protein [Paenibacillus polymyxa]MDY7993330.1 hypothetical protein [Paenibacillus polymyxa]MDY8120069.1 hypothetical protein [Paenibacillus polymyxa]